MNYAVMDHKQIVFIFGSNGSLSLRCRDQETCNRGSLTFAALGRT